MTYGLLLLLLLKSWSKLLDSWQHINIAAEVSIGDGNAHELILILLEHTHVNNCQSFEHPLLLFDHQASDSVIDMVVAVVVLLLLLLLPPPPWTSLVGLLSTRDRSRTIAGSMVCSMNSSANSRSRPVYVLSRSESVGPSGTITFLALVGC